MSDFDYTCPKCKSEYRVVGTKIPMRDKDSENCKVCGEEIISWNGGIMYSAQLLVRREEHLEPLYNLLEAVRELEKDVSKERLIEFITAEYEIHTHKCGDCKTDSIVLDIESQVYCLYCNKYIYEDLYTECKNCDCDGQGIIEEVRVDDGIWEERATCLKCGRDIPPDSCWHDGVTGYNFHRVVVDTDEHGNDKYEPVCNRCYQMLYGGSPY